MPNLINNPIEIGTVGATAGISFAHWNGILNGIGSTVGIFLGIVLTVIVIRKNIYDHRLKREAEERRKRGER